MDSDNLRVPPHSLELEQSVLCALLCFQEYGIFDTLKAEHFYRTSHQKIYAACQSSYRSSKVVDASFLVANMGEKLNEVGGAGYISQIMDAGTPTNTESYCQKIIAFWRMRKIIEVCNAAMKRSFLQEDPDEIATYMQTTINSTACNLSQWVKVSDVVDECISRCEALQGNSGITGVPSCYVDLDRYTAGFQPGDLVIIAARPGCGKTSLAVNSAYNSAMKGFKNGLMSLEMVRTQIGNRLLSMGAKVNGMRLRNGNLTSEDWERITYSAGNLHPLPLWIDDSPRASHRDIASKSRFLKTNSGLDILWIDYLGFVEGDKTRSKVYEVETITRELKALAKGLSIPVVLLCQLNRQCEMRENKRPILSDLRDSGAIEQDADVVLFLYNDSKYNDDSPDKGVIECEIAKQRNGPTARIRLAWFESYTLFENITFNER
jgi:replicative DNA helicase